MQRYFAHIAYNGKPYHGWQIQPNAASVQETIETALSTWLQEKIAITGCGRTDTGVHASSYYFHFETAKELAEEQAVFKLNGLTPESIAFFDVRKVPEVFHARFDARKRTYHYFIHTRKDPFLNDRSFYFRKPLDVDKMNEAAELLKAVKDFSSFCKSGSQTGTNLCDVTEAVWKQTKPYELRFTIAADRFLRNMVRAVVGTLIEVGKGQVKPEEIVQIAAAKDRGAAGYSVPAHGLFLADIQYEKHEEYLGEWQNQ